MKRLPVASLVVLVALGACAGGVATVQNPYPYPQSTARGALQDAAAVGPVLVEVRGNPFQGDVAAPFAEAASATSVGIPVRFTTFRGEAGKPGTRMVVQFDPAGDTTALGICDPAYPAPHAVPAGPLTALVALCKDVQPILSVSATAPRPERADSPVIRDIAQQAMLQMFTREAGGADGPRDGDNLTRRRVR